MAMVKDVPLASTSGDPHKKIAELEARIAKLEAVLKIGSGGSVQLKATSLTIESALSLNTKAGGSITIESALSMNTKAGGSITIQSAGPMQLKGSTVDIN